MEEGIKKQVPLPVLPCTDEVKKPKRKGVNQTTQRERRGGIRWACHPFVIVGPLLSP
jgi:hypothetical protein